MIRNKFEFFVRQFSVCNDGSEESFNSNILRDLFAIKVSVVPTMAVTISMISMMSISFEF